jgi:hypothetical protein
MISDALRKGPALLELRRLEVSKKNSKKIKNK